MGYDQSLKDYSKDTVKGELLKRLINKQTQIDSEQRLFVAGDTANTDIAVTGLLTTSVLKRVTRSVAGVPSDVTAEAGILTDGNLQLTTTDTTGDVLEVVWQDALAA